MKKISDYISGYVDDRKTISALKLFITSLKQVFKRGFLVVTGIKNNGIYVGRLKSKSRLRIAFRKGSKNNEIFIEDGFSGDVHIKVVGDGNRIYIGKNTILDGVSIELLNCNSLIAIGHGVSMGSGRINLSDGSGQFSSVYSGSAQVLEINKPSLDGLNVVIGDDCLIASNVTFMTSDGHPILNHSGERMVASGDVVIGKHVWFGEHVKVLKNTHIGNGCIIGTGSVVTRSIHQNTIAAGNPCKPIKQDFGFWSRSVAEDKIKQARTSLQHEI